MVNLKKERTASRAKLHSNQERERQVRAAADAARIALDQAKDQRERAETLVRDRQEAIHWLDCEEAERIGQSWPPRSPSLKEREHRRSLEDDLASGVRTLKAVEAHAEAARLAFEKATLKANGFEKETAAAVLAVMVEEAELAIERWCAARKAAIEAEKAVRSFIQVLTQRQCFAEVERLSNKFRDLGRQREYEIDPTPYKALFDRLRSDPDAVVTP